MPKFGYNQTPAGPTPYCTAVLSMPYFLYGAHKAKAGLFTSNAPNTRRYDERTGVVVEDAKGRESMVVA